MRNTVAAGMKHHCVINPSRNEHVQFIFMQILYNALNSESGGWHTTAKLALTTHMSSGQQKYLQIRIITNSKIVKDTWHV